MKALKIITWVSGVIAGILIILAVLTLILNKHLFGVNHVINYFHAANSFLLVAICCQLYKPDGKS